MPGWDLEQWADEILGLPRPGTIHSRRIMYTTQEMRHRARLDVYYGEDLQRFGYDSEGNLLYYCSADEWRA